MVSPDSSQVTQHADPEPSQEQKRDGGDAQAQEPESEIKAVLKPEKACLFAGVFGDGKKPEGVSRPVFMSKAAQAAVSDLKKVGTFRRTSGGQLFYFLEKPKPRVVPLIADDIRLKTLINTKFNINAASREVFSHIVTAMQMECFENGLVAEVHQLSHFDRRSKTAYFSLMDGAYMLKLTGKGDPVRVPNGTDGVFFLEDASWEPWKLALKPRMGEKGKIIGMTHEEGIAKKYLVDPIEFVDTEFLSKDEQRWLFMMWLRTVMMDLSERPLLLIYGQHGSGKTTALQLVKKAIFGRNADVNKVSKEDDFVAGVTNSPLFVLDNADDFTEKWFGDSLATVATGISFTRRMLYTTNTEVSFPARAWVAVTSRTARFIDNRPDIADRFLVFSTSRPEGKFKGRQAAFDEIAANRNKILTDLVYQLQDYVARWRAVEDAEESTFRMAAFGVAVDRFAGIHDEQGMAARVWKALEKSQVELLIKDDPLVLFLRERFDRQGHELEYGGSAAQIATDVNHHLGTHINGRSMGQKIAVLWPILENEFGATRVPGRSRSVKYKFKRKEKAGETVNAGENADVGNSPQAIAAESVAKTMEGELVN
jgi:hypothetical protein